ncbi:MAG: hypothetical protein ABH811_01785 [archaeon]
MEKHKMDAKSILVSFLTIVCVLFLVATVNAFTVDGDLADVTDIKVNGIYADSDDIAVIAGETIDVKVYFTSNIDGSDIRIKAELEGEKVDVEDRTSYFDVEAGKRYSKTLTLKVPYELKDVQSDDLSLNVKIWNGDFATEIEDILLRVQRPSYNADLKSISVSKTVEAGESFPVDLVLKNTGYNDLEDLYVKVSISALGIEKSSYFGDLVAIEEDTDDDDDTDTISGRLYLSVPYDVQSGVYTLEVEVINEDTTSSEVRQIIIKNDFSSPAIANTLRRSVSAGEEAEYSLLIVNPTNKLKVYRIVSESSGSLSSKASESVIAVPAGSSETVKIIASADKEGDYDFRVDVISGETIEETVAFTLSVKNDSTQVSSPIVILTVVLAIIFLVLLVVLIVLLGKKPEKTEEFGESYY